MLQKLNERIQGFVAWLIIILIAITFTLFGVDYYLQSHQATKPKVLVNNQPISEQAFEISYRRARSQQNPATLTPFEDKKLQMQVLEQMIANEVTIQAAKASGFEVSINQANSAIVNIPQFQEEGRFSTEKYKQALNGALFTPETFQTEVRQGMLLNQQRFAFVASSFALPMEIERFVTLYMQTRDYEYLIIPASGFLNQMQPDLQAIKAYYQEHQKNFLSPEKISLDYVVLSLQDIKKTIEIPKATIQSFYEENKANFVNPAKWRVAHILFAIPEQAGDTEIATIQKKAESTYAALQKNPKAFKQWVSQVSDDKLSVAAEGVLPWITAGNAEYDKWLAPLTTPGQITAPQRTKHGFEIFQLLAYEPVTTKPLAAVEATIKEQLLTDKAQEKYSQALEQLTDVSYQTPDSLKPVAELLHLPIQKTPLFTRQGGDTEITKNKAVLAAAFSHDVLQLNNNSEPLSLDNGRVLVLRINTHLPAKQEPLTAVSDQIKTILVKQLASTKAREIGVQFLTSNNLPKQEELIKANKLQWSAINNAPRDNDKPNTIFNEIAFGLIKPDAREGVTLPNGDYAVIKLRAITNGKIDTLNKEQVDSMMQQIEASYGMMDYDLYVTNLINKAQIVRY